MSRRDQKEDELRKFAEIIMNSSDRKEMMQKLNGYARGIQNGNVKLKRVEILKNLIYFYK